MGRALRHDDKQTKQGADQWVSPVSIWGMMISLQIYSCVYTLKKTVEREGIS